MSIQRIDNKRKRMHGWQARVPHPLQTGKRLTKWFADKRNGGIRKSALLALKAERDLWNLQALIANEAAKD